MPKSVAYQTFLTSRAGADPVRGSAPKPARRANLTAVEIPDDAPTISVMDESNPHSLINLVSAEFGEVMKKIPKRYFLMHEKDLTSEVEPDEMLDKLKLRFWDEWQLCLLADVKGRLSLSSVFYGVCTEEYFYENVVRSLPSLAYVIIPPTDYVVTMRDVLNKGIRRLLEIIDLPLESRKPMLYKGEPVRGDDGEIICETKLERGVITEIRQIVALLSDRLHGAVVQKLDVSQKSLSLNLSSSTQDLLGAPISSDKEISELEKIDDQLKRIADVLETTESSEESKVIDATEVIDADK